MWYFIVGCFLVSACTGESLYADIIDNVRIKRQNHQQQQQQPQQPLPQYRPYNEAPNRIKELLQLQQAREPLVHLPAHSPPQLQQLHAQATAPGVQRAAAPQHQQAPLLQPTQYNPKVQYGQTPQQPTYKGIQAGPAQPLSGPAQGGYTPQYNSQYNNQYQQPQPNALYRPDSAGPPAGQGGYQSQQQPQSQFPKGLPPHIQKIIESQRAYQG